MKTNPYGVRFEEEDLRLLQKEKNITTPQKAVNFLFQYWKEHRKYNFDFFTSGGRFQSPQDSKQVTEVKIEMPKNNVNAESIDYQKLFNDCEYPDEYKALWEKINSDINMPKKEKDLWKIRLNAK